jgi:hypothetical protein
MTPSMGNGIPLTPGLSQAYRTPPPDRTLVVRHLLSALESLKKVHLLASPFYSLTLL